ncbi:MAG: 4Fe-4S binding protein [Treponema sp.]|nr:4Fe-4S binding protein [Treponema sp.]
MMKKTSRLDKIRTPYIWANHGRCIACWDCIDSCPKRVIGKVDFLWHKHIVIKNAEACTGCKKCIWVCPRQVFSEKTPDLRRLLPVKNGTGFF